jgi:hypothetical protein
MNDEDQSKLDINDEEQLEEDNEDIEDEREVYK